MGKRIFLKTRSGQSLIVQFILFFLIGLGIFIGVGTFFKIESDLFRKEITESYSKLINSYLSSIALSAISCKRCDYVEFNSKIEYTPADYVVHMEMGDFGLRISTRQGIANATTSIHNLNETFDCSGETTSLTPLTLTYDRTQNKLEIG